MKFILLTLAALFAMGCAGNAEPKKDSSENSSATNAQSAKPSDPLTSEKILALQREGYTLTNQDGEQYFCRKEMKTGSRLAHETICMTEKEIDELREQTQRGLGNIQRQQPPPQGK